MMKYLILALIAAIIGAVGARLGGSGGKGCLASILLGFIGALVYFISQARDFREGVIGFFKAIVWPAILVYEIFKLLKIGQAEAKAESQEVTE